MTLVKHRYHGRRGDCGHPTVMAMRVKGIGVALSVSVAILALGSCQQGPGSTESTDTSLYTSRIFTVRASQFRVAYDSVSNSSAGAIGFDMDEITKEIVNEGIVQAHLDSPGGGEVWIGLPFVLSIEYLNRTITLTASYSYAVGRVAFVVNGNLLEAEMRAVLPVFDGMRVRVVVGNG